MNFKVVLAFLILIFVNVGCEKNDFKISKYTISYKLKHRYKIPFGAKINTFINLNQVKFFKVDDSLMVGLDIYPFSSAFVFSLKEQKIWKEIKPFTDFLLGVEDYHFFNKDSLFLLCQHNYRYSYDSSFVVTNSSYTHYKIFDVPDTFLVTQKTIPNLYSESFKQEDVAGKKFIDNTLILPEYNKIVYTYYLDTITGDNMFVGAVYDYKTGGFNYLNVSIPGYKKGYEVPKVLKYVYLFKVKNRDRFFIRFGFTPYVYLYDVSDEKIIDTLKFASEFFDEFTTTDGNNEGKFDFYGNKYFGFYYLKGNLLRGFHYNPNHYPRGVSIMGIYDTSIYKLKGEVLLNAPDNEDGLMTIYNDEFWFTHIDNDTIYINEYEVNFVKIPEEKFKHKVDSILQVGFEMAKKQGVCEPGGSLTQAKNGGWNYLKDNVLQGEKNYVAVILSKFGCHSCNETVLQNLIVNQAVFFHSKMKKDFYLVYVNPSSGLSAAKNELKNIGIPLTDNVLIDTTNLYPVKYNKSAAQNPRLVVVDSLGNLKVDSVYEVGNQASMVMDMLGVLLGK